MSQPVATNTSESSDVNPLTVKITMIVLAALAFGLAFLIWRFPLQEHYIGRGSLRFALLVFLVQLFWSPIGAVLCAGVGLFIGAAALLPDKKTDEPSHISKSPQPAQHPEAPKRDRVSIAALLPAGNLQLEASRLQGVLEHLHADAAPSVEIIEFPASKPGQWWARVRFGQHSIRLIGKPEALPDAVQARTIRASLLEADDQAIMARHQAHAVLQYERGSDTPGEQLLALHTVAAAYLEQGLYGVVDEQAEHAVPRLPIQHYVNSKELADRIMPELTLGRVRFKSANGQTWFATRGHQRFNLPNLAYLGSDSDAELAEDLFNNLCLYIHRYQAVIEAGHTAEIGKHHMRFSATDASTVFLEHGGVPTLVIHRERPAMPEPAPVLISRSQAGQAGVWNTPEARQGTASPHRPLTPEEAAWVMQQVKHGIRIVIGVLGRNNFSNMNSTLSVPMAVQFVGDIRESLEKIRARGLSHEQLENAATALGLLWGQLAVYAYGYEWTRSDASTFTIVDPDSQLSQNPNQQFEFPPVALMRGILFGDNTPDECRILFTQVLGAARQMTAPAARVRQPTNPDIQGMKVTLN